MKLFELIEYIDANGIQVETHQGKLSITADDPALVDSVVDAFRTYKRELAAYYLREPLTSHAPDPARLYPLSFAQQRLYFLYQYNGNALQFNLPAELRIQGALNVDAFLHALDRMIGQHPIHQTTYSVVDGMPAQRYESQRSCDCAYVDISALPADEIETQLAAARTKLAQTPFDLETELPLRMQLLRTGIDTYSLLLVFHHIATDEWSLIRLIEDLARGYGAKCSGEAETPRSRFTYFDFVVWQRARFERGAYEVARSYWRDHLDGAPRVLELPLDRPRPAQQTYQHGLVSRVLPAPLRGAVAALAQRLKITEFALYLSVYYLLLQRLTGQNDLVVGIDVYGRDSEHFKDVAGFFVNQLALRSQVPLQDGTGQYLQQVGRMAMRNLTFQEMPFEKVVDDLQSDRETAYSPVFQVKFLFHGNTLDLNQFAGLKVATRDSFDAQSQYDATLQVHQHEVRLHYNADLFLESRVRGWLDTYFSLLEECLAESDRPIRDLLNKRLREQLADFTQGSRKVVSHDAIFRRIERAISAAPQQLAVLTPEHRITYAELGQRIGSTAQHLETLGIQRGDKVGVYLERSIDMVVAVVATLSTGAVLVPLDTSYPAERINEILMDSGVSAVITNAALADHLGDYYGIRLAIGRMYLQPSPESPLIRGAVDGSAPAYLLYTSGSTGRPKGVLVSHASFANLCDWYIDFAGIDAASRVLLMIPIGFDAALKNILAPLMSGATLVLSPPPVFDPDALLRLIDTSGVTTINCAPSAIYALLHADQARSYRSLRHLRMLAVGGEALQLEALKPWLRSAECHSWLANIYGPTECTDISAAYKADRGEWLAREQVVIGRPIQNTQAYIVDDSLRLCPPGAIGELVIAGRGVAMGYHQQPEESTSPFVRCDLSRQTVYRSGDICRYDRDGFIVYLGRRDGQVKIRGKRVETDEVLAQLARLLPGRALSVQLYARNGAEMLVAFAEGDAPSDAVATMREELLLRLPRHAVPTQILFLPKLPLTPNGKISGSALLDWYEAERGRDADAPTRPLTRTETVIASVWSRLLKAPVTDPQTDFFSLGGDSIISIQLVADLHEHGFAVTVADIFKYPSVEQLAALCDRLAQSAVPAPRHERVAPFALLASADRADLPADLEDAYPLTPLQLGMLFHSDMERGGAVYHDVFAYDLALEYHAAAFKEAIQRVVNRHPVLRTCFDLHSFSTPLQLVWQQVTARISQTDISALSEPQQDEAIRAALERLKRTAFDISTPGLIRFTILKRSEGRIYFIVDAHHVILDGWSMATLKRQIFEQYLHLTRGASLSRVFDSGSLRFSDYVASQARDESDAVSREFWRAYCRSCGTGAISALPALSGDARFLAVNVDSSLVQQLDALSKREGVALKTLLLLAHSHMLRTFVGDEKVTTALTDNGRLEAQGAENVVGLFLNVLPFHATFAQQTWRQLAEAAHADDVDRKPYRRFPFAGIVRDNRALQIDSLFTYNDFHVADELIQSDALTLLDTEDFSYSNFKLSTLAFRNFESGITVRLIVRVDLSQCEVEMVLQQFLSALRHIAEGFDDPIPAGAARPLPCFEAGSDPARHRYAHLRYKGRFDRQAFEASAALLALRQRCQGGSLAAIPEEQLLSLAIADGAEWSAEVRESLFAAADPDAALQVLHGQVLRDDDAGWQQLALRFSAPRWNGVAAEALAADLLTDYLAVAENVRELQVRVDSDGSWVSCERAARDADYWAARCHDISGPLSLPADHSTRSGTELLLRQAPISLGSEWCTGARELASRCSVSLLAVELSAWLLLLARLSGEHAVVTGVSACAPELPSVFPLSIDLADDPNVLQVVARVEAALAAAAKHRYIPAHAQQNCRQTRFELRGPKAAARKHEQRGELALTLIENASDVTGTLSYDSGIFDPASARRFAGHYANLLAAMVADASKPVSQLELLGAAERQHVLESFNATAREYPKEALIHELFEAQVERTPDAVAVVDGARQLSYRALNEQANRATHALRAQGVSTGSIVGLHVARSLEQVVGVLAILKAGAAYLPLEPDYPDSRLAYMCQDSSVELIVSVKSLRERSTEWCACVLCLDDEQALAVYPASAPVVADLNSQQLAYVIYTSGSTGQPKGVLVPHQGVVNYLSHAQSYLQPQHRGAVMSTPLSFDATVTTLFTPLLAGKCLVVLPSEASALFAGLSHYLFREGSDWLFKLTPAHLEGLYASYPTDEPLQAQQNSLVQRHGLTRHCLVIGGEQLMTATLSKWIQHCLPNAVYVNEYGPTETVVGCSVYEVRGLPDLRRCGHAVAIGRPIQNTQLYILDAHRQPVPVGVNGEIYIGGAGVARGYLNRTELTQERFLADPFSAEPGARMYRTGDVGKWNAQGHIELLGRNDHQVKIRGYRIELGEIEAQLARVPGVRQAVVIAREDVPGEKRLVAYVAGAHITPLDARALDEVDTQLPGHRPHEAGTHLNAQTLRMALAKELPEYMVPVAYVRLEQLPLTANGKLDRRALPAPETEAYVQRRYEAPVGEIEQALAQIWSDLLGVEQVGREDSFFELGGHSLLAVRLVSRIRSRFQVDISVHEIFEHALLKAMADSLTAKQIALFSAEHITELSDELDRLSADELRALLAEQE